MRQKLLKELRKGSKGFHLDCLGHLSTLRALISTLHIPQNSIFYAGMKTSLMSLLSDSEKTAIPTDRSIKYNQIPLVG